MMQFPLEKIENSQLIHLSQVLWAWQLCNGCLKQKECTDCPSLRFRRLGRFFDYYKDLTSSFETSQSV